MIPESTQGKQEKPWHEGLIKDSLLDETEALLEKKKKELTLQDHCTVYVYDFTGDKEDFNLRFSSPEMAELLKHDRTPTIFNDIINIIRIGSNIIIMIYGPRNSGKSEMGQTLGKYYVNSYVVLKGKDSEMWLAFSDDEMQDEVYPNMDEGHVGIRDESPDPSGEGSDAGKKSLRNICQITRGFQVSFIFINPDKIVMEGVDYYIECAGKCYETRTIRGILYDRKGRIMGPIYIKLHDDEKFRKEYKMRKKENIKGVLRDSGIITGSSVSKVKLERDAVELYEFCNEKGHHYRKDVESDLEYIHLWIRKMKGTGHYNKILVNEVFKALNGEESLLDELMEDHVEKKELEEEKPRQTELHQKLIDFIPEKKKYDLDFIFDLIREEVNWRKPERDLEIYRKRKEEKYLLREIASQYKELKGKDSIKKILIKVEGEVSRHVGAIHERDYATYLERLKIFDDVKRLGGKEEPDIIAKRSRETWVFSLKCYGLSSGPITIPVDEFYVEIEHANRIKHVEKKEVFCHLVFLNKNTFETELHEIDLNNPKSIRVGKGVQK